MRTLKYVTGCQVPVGTPSLDDHVWATFASSAVGRAVKLGKRKIALSANQFGLIACSPPSQAGLHEGRTAARRMGLQADRYQPPWPNDPRLSRSRAKRRSAESVHGGPHPLSRISLSGLWSLRPARSATSHEATLEARSWLTRDKDSLIQKERVVANRACEAVRTAVVTISFTEFADRAPP
jgi:hypothetical protein